MVRTYILKPEINIFRFFDMLEFCNVTALTRQLHVGDNVILFRFSHNSCTSCWSLDRLEKFVRRSAGFVEFFGWKSWVFSYIEWGGKIRLVADNLNW